jgi:hypothetical protein
MRAAGGILLVAACASAPAPAPRGGPRGLRASEHLELARQHDDMAREQVAVPPSFDSRDEKGVVWMRAWDPSAEHERIAAAHRTEAAALQAEYDEACGARSGDEVSVSPLQRYAVGGWPTSTGIIMYLSADAGTPDKLLADLRCHRAWMMLAPAGMDECPLDLPGIVLDARGDREGVTLSIVIKNPKLVDELHRRAAHDLELGAQLQHTREH